MCIQIFVIFYGFITKLQNSKLAATQAGALLQWTSPAEKERRLGNAREGRLG
jgi:hypothetical protein